jgi:hydrocephalus-inducing protein
MYIENEIYSNNEKDKEKDKEKSKEKDNKDNKDKDKDKEKEIDIYSPGNRNNLNKKFIHNSNLLSNLLKGEIKLRIENKKFIYFTLEDYIRKLFINKNSNENINNINNSLNTNDQINIFESELKKNQMKNNLNLSRLIKEIIDRKKKEDNEKKEIYLKKLELLKDKEKDIKKKETGNKIVNIKFDIKDLIFEEKFKKFDKEIKQLNDVKNKNKIKNKENIIGTSKKNFYYLSYFFLFFNVF